MAELLKDNVEAERRRLSGENRTGQRLGHREVPDFESWLQCLCSSGMQQVPPQEPTTLSLETQETVQKKNRQVYPEKDKF